MMRVLLLVSTSSISSSFNKLIFIFRYLRLGCWAVICQFFMNGEHTWAFDAGEHALIGDLAFERVSEGRPNSVKSLEVDIEYRYGHLVALLGDMYKSVEEISLTDPILLDGYYGRNREGLKKCVDKEIYSIRNKKEYSGCGDLKLIEKKTRYITLAHDNYTHFAWHNIKQYIEFHERALWLAELAHLKCSKTEWEKHKSRCEAGKKRNKRVIAKSKYKKKLSYKHRKFPELFPRRRLTKQYLENISKDKMEALVFFTNAYADHFLSDTFSAGHLRTPRSQIDTWVKAYEENGQGSDSKYSYEGRKKGTAISGALTQFLHHRDGGITGIEVSNSKGDLFKIRGDKQLFSVEGGVELSGDVDSHVRVQPPVAAVEASLSEVFAVLRKGSSAQPDAEFSALEYVPFIVDRKNTLKAMIDEEINLHGSIKEAVKSMPTEMELIFRARAAIKKIPYDQYFSDFAEAIPVMMAELREQIKRESEESKIKKRIPHKLLLALRVLE